MRSIYCIFILLTIFSSEVHSQFVFNGKVVSGEQAKPLQGFGGAGVLEVVEDHMASRRRSGISS